MTFWDNTGNINMRTACETFSPPNFPFDAN